MTKLSEVRIKQQCRETHGHEEAYDKASEIVKIYYKMFATESNHSKTFVLTLSIENHDKDTVILQ